jgi:hypothetical protein
MSDLAATRKSPSVPLEAMDFTPLIVLTALSPCVRFIYTVKPHKYKTWF